MLDQAQAPIVWAGGGARRSADAVRALAEALDAPVITTYNGKGTLPTGHPLHAGSSVEEPSMRHLVERADLCLALGTRFSQETTANWTLPIPAALVHVDLDAGRFGRTYPPAEGIVSDVGLFCRALLDGGVTAGSRDGEAAVRAAIQGRNSEVAAQGVPDEIELMHLLHDTLPEDAIVIADMTVVRVLGGPLPRREAARLVRLPGLRRPGMRRPARARHRGGPPRPADGRHRRRRRVPDGRPRAPDGVRRGPPVRHAGRERLGLRDPAQLPGDDVRADGRGRAERT